MGLDWALATPRQIVLAGEPGAADMQALLRVVHAGFVPHRVLLLADGGAGQAHLAQRLPFLAGLEPSEGRATAHVCQNYACQLPVTEPEALAAQLAQARIRAR